MSMSLWIIIIILFLCIIYVYCIICERIIYNKYDLDVCLRTQSHKWHYYCSRWRHWEFAGLSVLHAPICVRPDTAMTGNSECAEQLVFLKVHTCNNFIGSTHVQVCFVVVAPILFLFCRSNIIQIFDLNKFELSFGSWHKNGART